MKIHIIMHESFESPGAIVHWADNRGYSVDYSRVYNYEPLPTIGQLANTDMLVVMGGPQSPATTKEECPYFDAQAEIEVIKNAIDLGKIVFGACLGAQLIGESLGADFEHSPHREIGYFEVVMVADYKNDDAFSTFPNRFLVGHWHGDMPGLTEDSKVFASSEGCPRQIVKYTPLVYGFQCHLEFTPEALEGMIENCSNELEKYRDLPYIQQPDALRKADTITPNHMLFDFLDVLASRYEKVI